ncbi:50S ribosomal protein L30 [Veillonella sp.]|uniref:50S ribosomal protein L30 n=1 Tax=Veillonella sp. TaxID=1926307 RepID=UPI001D664C83|nr:50S ribosomal protein L30 [Veillonella sp.]MBS6650556.1 50S ribosomal protein L30 [Veillonella sp.]
MAQVKVTLTRSLIGRPEDQRATVKERATVKALGLKKTNSQVVKEVTPQIQGMLHKVRHLVKVEEV